MKIERINDSQIRCTLSNFDLSVRNVSLSELAYGSDKARSLFREMIQKASNEVGFEADDIPLMVEAIPLSNESVMLVITKVDDPEEMDTRFSKFAPAPDDISAAVPANPAMTGLEGAEQILSGHADPSASDKDSKVRIFVFSSLDQVINAAVAVKENKTGSNTLYKNPADSRYYLVLENSIRNSIVAHADFASTCNMLAEYGKKAKQTYSSASYCREHYEVIIPEHALQSLAKIG